MPIATAGVVAVGALATNVIGIFKAATEGPRFDAQARIYQASVAAAAFTTRLTGIDILTMGVSVFKVKRHLAVRRSWCFLYLRQELHRVERVRLSDLPQPTTVTWGSGKGAIGRCLATRRWQHKDWSPVVARFAGAEPTADEFDQLPEDDRSGFTYDEFVGIVHKYAEVIAVPIMSVGGSSIVGVLAIDRRYDAGLQEPVFDTDDVRDAAETAAVAIVDDVPKAPILD
jgi:hypothetical protein